MQSLALATARAESVSERLHDLYLRAREVRVYGPDGQTETLSLRAPTQRLVLEASVSLRREYRAEFELAETPLPEGFDFETASPAEQDHSLAINRANTALLVMYLRLCCRGIRSWDDQALEMLIEINGGNSGELAEAVTALCGRAGLEVGGDSDPFSSPPTSTEK